MMDEHAPLDNEQAPPADQAAVQMPSEGVAEETNGVADTHAAPPAPSEHPVRFERTSSFWQHPPPPATVRNLPPGTYIHPPFYPSAPQTEQELRQRQQYLRQAGYEIEATELGFQFRRLVQAPGYEVERLRHELEPERLRLQEAIAQTKRELAQKENQFIQQMAKARLPLLSSSRKRRDGQVGLPAFTPSLVEEALTHDFATADEICGQHGVTPTSERESGWAMLNRIAQWLTELFAPLSAGLILGVNIAVITGFLRLEDFRQGRQMWLVALAAFIGFFIEKLVGTVYYQLANALAQASERPFEEETARPFPRLHNAFALSVLGLFALVLGAAVVVVDALGLRMLHEQAVQQAKLLGTEAGEVLPFWVYLIAGCVISLPYLVYKAMMGWRQGELRLREARIAFLRWKHVEERRGDPEVQAAFRLAQEVVGLQDQLDSLEKSKKEIQDRLDSAQTQVRGCQAEFAQYWQTIYEQLIAHRDGVSLARGGRPLPFNRRAMGEQPDTLLRRWMRMFRRG